jgi:hypothetical protein
VATPLGSGLAGVADALPDEGGTAPVTGRWVPGLPAPQPAAIRHSVADAIAIAIAIAIVSLTGIVPMMVCRSASFVAGLAPCPGPALPRSSALAMSASEDLLARGKRAFVSYVVMGALRC